MLIVLYSDYGSEKILMSQQFIQLLLAYVIPSLIVRFKKINTSPFINIQKSELPQDMLILLDVSSFMWFCIIANYSENMQTILQTPDAICSAIDFCDEDETEEENNIISVAEMVSLCLQRIKNSCIDRTQEPKQ